MSSGPIPAAKPMYWSHTSSYHDVRTQATKQIVEADLSKLADKMEREFMAKMEARIWSRLQGIKDLQDNYDKILGPAVDIPHDKEAYREKRGLSFGGTPVKYEKSLETKMKDAFERTTLCPPIKYKHALDYNGEKPWYAMSIDYAYSPKLTPVDNLWKETEEWLKDVNIN